jgi:hypothetical protein
MVYNGIIDSFSDAKSFTKVVFAEIIEFFKYIFNEYTLNPHLHEHVSTTTRKVRLPD